MEPKNTDDNELKPISVDFFERLWEKSWTYIKTVVDVVREPVLILDEKFCVLAANEPFYRTFQVEEKDTTNRLVYELGNGQWDIPALRKLLENILPKNTFFKGFEVTHDFPLIGKKMMILNARQIHFREDIIVGPVPHIIMLAMEDITEMMDVAEMLARHTNQFQSTMLERTGKLEVHIKDLEEEVARLKNTH